MSSNLTAIGNAFRGLGQAIYKDPDNIVEHFDSFYTQYVPMQFYRKNCVHQIWIRPLNAVAYASLAALKVVDTVIRLAGTILLFIPYWISSCKCRLGTPNEERVEHLPLSSGFMEFYSKHFGMDSTIAAALKVVSLTCASIGRFLFGAPNDPKGNVSYKTPTDIYYTPPLRRV